MITATKFKSYSAPGPIPAKGNIGKAINFSGQNEEAFFQAAENDDVLQAARLMNAFHLDVNVTDSFKSTSLMKAAAKKQSKMVDFLLQRGADPSLKNKFKDTALHRAAKSGDKSSALSLIQAYENRGLPFKRVVNHEGSTALHPAVQSGNLALVQALLTVGFDPHLKNHNKETPVHLAKKAGNQSILNALEDSDPALVDQSEPFDADYRGSKLFHDTFIPTRTASVQDTQLPEPITTSQPEPYSGNTHAMPDNTGESELSPFQRLFSRFMAGESLYEDQPEQVREIISQPEVLEEFAFRVHDDLDQLPENKESVEKALCLQYFQTSGALQQFWHRATKAITDKLPIELAQEYPDTRNLLAMTRPEKLDTSSKRPQKFGFNSVIGMEYLKALFTKHIIKPLQGVEDDEFITQKPNGILLYGPSRTGKTHMSKALADELGFNFMSRSGADLIAPLQGQSMINVRNMFQEARENSPTVLLIDEVNQMVPNRRDVLNNQADMPRIVDQFLLELDEAGKHGIFTIGTSNLPTVIDNAIKQPGRLDRSIPIGLPDEKTRATLFESMIKTVALKPLSIKPEFYQELAKASEDFSAGDIKYSISQAINEYHNDKSRPFTTYLKEVVKATHPGNEKSAIEAFKTYLKENSRDASL